MTPSTAIAWGEITNLDSRMVHSRAAVQACPLRGLPGFTGTQSQAHDDRCQVESLIP
jgi:hypothetical protein